MNAVLVKRGIPIVVLVLALCGGAIALARAVGRELRVGPPLLIYGIQTNGEHYEIMDRVEVVIYDPRRDETRDLFPELASSSSEFNWSPDRTAALRVTLGAAEPSEELVFTFALYPDWLTEAIDLPGRFDGYSTPAWAPDGGSVIVPACRRVGDDPGCDPFVFYRISRDGTAFEALEHAALADFPRAWAWRDDHTLRVWQAATLLDLDLDTGATVTLFDGLPPQPRAVRWTADRSRLAYYTSTEEPFCLYVYVVGETAPQTVSCDAIDMSAPFGWLAEGQTVYYARGADHEIRLYDSTARADRSAADPPAVLVWSLDTLYSLPGTSLLLHHTTFNEITTSVIDTALGKTQLWGLNLGHLRTDAQFIPAPTGWPVAVRWSDPGTLGLLRPGQSQVFLLHSHACCTLTWKD